MKSFILRIVAVGMLALASVCVVAQAPQSECKPVHGDLVENRSLVGCKPGDDFCFLGVVDGNHGLRGTTYFKGQASLPVPPQSPGWRSYSGTFEYTTSRGTLVMRETGLTNPGTGAVLAFQQIVDATGELAGYTGHFVVNGFNVGGHIETKLTGELCEP